MESKIEREKFTRGVQWYRLLDPRGTVVQISSSVAALVATAERRGWRVVVPL